jgi:hypothetical protein
MVSEDIRHRSKVYTTFIDILFVVVMGQSFVLLASSNGISSWMANPTANIIPIADTILGFALIVTSWIRYHPSVEMFPHKSSIRFILDLGLLFFYFLVFVYNSSFVSVSIIFVIVFAIYSIWTAVRCYEYKEYSKRFHLVKRTLEAFGFTVGFVIIVILLHFYSNQTLEGVYLASSFVLLIGYRGLLWKNAQAFSESTTQILGST